MLLGVRSLFNVSTGASVYVFHSFPGWYWQSGVFLPKLHVCSHNEGVIDTGLSLYL